MKPNNILYHKCTDRSFYRDWLTFLEPFHKLTSREMDVAARILRQYFTLRETIKDPDVLHEVMWMPSSRKDMRTSLGMTPAHFQIQLANLKKAGFLRQDNSIEPRFIPHTAGDPRFYLLVVTSSTQAEP